MFVETGRCERKREMLVREKGKRVLGRILIIFIINSKVRWYFQS